MTVEESNSLPLLGLAQYPASEHEEGSPGSRGVTAQGQGLEL